jgi:glycerol-3-phosphate acyltransferase PlsY
MNFNYLIAIGAYLIGSIPSAVWIGKALCGVDVRESGSKNAGATNTMRVLGVKVGIPVLLIDIFKGFSAVKLALCSSYMAGSNAYVNFQLVLGVCAVLGHVFPIFAGFRGGKGVATIAGVLLALHLPATLVAGGVFFCALLISKRVSVGSLLMGISYPISIIAVFKSEFLSLKIFSLAICVLLFVTHRKNIYRLLKGEENKAHFLFGRRKQ